MIRTTTILLATAAALTACGKDDKKEGGGGGGGKSCPALKVTIDGKEVTGISHGLAITHKRSGDVTEQVEMYNHDKVTCEEILNKNGRQTGEDEVAVRAFTSTSMGNGIGIEAHTQMGADVFYLGKGSPKAGDTVSMCVTEKKVKPNAGLFKDKEVTIGGLMTGKHCGTMEW
jgi:hypothetical protein